MKTQKLNNKGFRGYIFSREINGNFIPQRVQNLVIKDFAVRNNLFFKLSTTEYKMYNSFHMLKALIEEIKKINGIIFYSFEMLPESKILRNKILNKFLKNKKTVFFALEEIKLKNKKDLDKLDNLIFIKNESMKKFNFSKKINL